MNRAAGGHAKALGPRCAGLRRDCGRLLAVHRWCLSAQYVRLAVRGREHGNLDIARELPGADPDRVGLLGFSLGGVYSLLIAAHAPERVQAVVAYYPVTDFPSWLTGMRSEPWMRPAFFPIRWWFHRESGAQSDAEYERMLRAASPYYAADAIAAPVLLVHGDRDTSAPIEESERMAERLRMLNKPARLLVVPGGRHIFNFRQPREAAFAWAATVEWLERYLHPSSS